MVSDKQSIISENRRRGRGSRSNTSGRFEPLSREDFDDGWETMAEAPAFKTEVTEESARSVITTNKSPDVPFEQSINAYRGCEHGCPYCFARPSHAYMGLSPGLDFESRLFAKPNLPEVLRKELANPRYVPKTIALGTNTDPYQPIERQYKLTRSILEIMNETSHPVGVVTKSALVTRDIDILSQLAKKDLVRVGLSITSLDRKTARSMEPRASTPAKRIEALKQLSDAGVQTMLMLAPVIPGINDHELENILEQAAEAGASSATYILIRLPLEIKDILEEWLHTDFPDRAAKVYSIIRSMRDGNLYQNQFGTRMRGTGPYADMIENRFNITIKRLNLNTDHPPLRTDLFQRPRPQSNQLELF